MRRRLLVHVVRALLLLVFAAEASAVWKVSGGDPLSVVRGIYVSTAMAPSDEQSIELSRQGDPVPGMLISNQQLTTVDHRGVEFPAAGREATLLILSRCGECSRAIREKFQALARRNPQRAYFLGLDTNEKSPAFDATLKNLVVFRVQQTDLRRRLNLFFAPRIYGISSSGRLTYVQEHTTTTFRALAEVEAASRRKPALELDAAAARGGAH